MKRAIHIRCMQQFLYFESHIKSLKQLHIIVCFGRLSISSAFTISTYFINMATQKKFQEKNDIGYMYKQWFKNKVKHKQREHYICVDLGINRYYICTEKEHYSCPQNVPKPFSHLHGLPVIQNIFNLFIIFFAFCSMTDDAIWIIHNFRQPLK